MVKHYSNNIQNIIQGELFAASQSIKIAVAWFTNDLLFQPLLLKLATGVKIDIILNKDDINLSSSINFDLFVQQGGNLYWNESNRLMHDKFCIIDDRVVITGSYNWTNKAEVNYESITVFSDESESLQDYNVRFQSLKRNFVKQTVQSRPQPIVNKGKCPVSLQPYTKLKFYHSIKLFESENTPILANQYEGGPYALLDNKTFLPRTQFMFSDYSSFIPGRNYLWLKGETKWGLFDCEKLEFVVKPSFILVEDCTYKHNGQFPYFRLRSSCCKYYGAYILPKNCRGEDKLYDCKYDNIMFVENGKCSILDLHCEDYHELYNFNTHRSLGGEWCKKIEIKQPYDYNVIEMFDEYNRCTLYILEDQIELEDSYDSVSYHENYILLCKNGLYGAYVIGQKKLIECVYDNITYKSSFGRGVLCMQAKKYPEYSYEKIKEKSINMWHGHISEHSNDAPPILKLPGYIVEDISISDLKTFSATSGGFYSINKGDIVVFPQTIEQVELKKWQSIRNSNQCDICIKVNKNGVGAWLSLGILKRCNNLGKPIHAVSKMLKKCKNDAQRVLALLGTIIIGTDTIRYKKVDKDGSIRELQTTNIVFEETTYHIVYVLDSQKYIGGYNCTNVKFEQCEIQCVDQNFIGGQTYKTEREYTVIILQTSQNKYRIYESHHNVLIDGEYDRFSLNSGSIYLYVDKPEWKSYRYDVKYGILKDLQKEDKEREDSFKRLKESWQGPVGHNPYMTKEENEQAKKEEEIRRIAGSVPLSVLLDNLKNGIK